MARNRMGIRFAGFEELMEKLDRLGGTDAMKRGVEAGLKRSKQYVNEEIKKSMAKSNLPAHGHYSEGDTMDSLDKLFTVDWDGLQGSIKVGFKLSENITSIFLMYGTPRHRPPMSAVPGLYDAIYGRRTQSKIKKLQKEEIQKVIQREMEG